jgi:histone acetyltransferase (RNA polymerase elongator complex component)
MLDTASLSRILQALVSGFPRLRRVGIYANARDVLGKTDAELAMLRQQKLTVVYLGLESGSDEVLRRFHKGITAAEMVEAVQRLKRAGIRASSCWGLGERNSRSSMPKKRGESSVRWTRSTSPCSP